jgi:hypothetical protein
MPRPFRIPIQSLPASCLFCLPVIAISCFLISTSNLAQGSIVLGILGGGLFLWCVREGVGAPACLLVLRRAHAAAAERWLGTHALLKTTQA